MVGFLALFLIDLAVTVLGYVLQPKTGSTTTAPSTPTAPTATEGGVVPIVFGTCKISPNTLWSGDSNAIDVTKKGQHVGYIYSLGLQLGICMGQIDELIDVMFGSNSAKNEAPSEISVGIQGLTSVTVISTPTYSTGTGAMLPLGLSDRSSGEKCILSIEAPNILGSKDPGGGVKGNLELYFGTSTQPANDYLTAEIADGMVSPYAGLCYAVFRPGAGTSHSFEWGLSPQLPNVAFTVRRCPDNLGVSEYVNISGDANPAEVIYELLTNTVWGLGKTAALFDLASFQAAAATLFGESLGYSQALTDTGTADDAISDVLRHIDGVLRRDPETGLTALALTRADYTIDELPVVDPSVASDCQWKPSSWSRTTNHVNVAYTARDFDFAQKVVTAENLANIQSTGEVRAETIQFLGLSNPTVAQTVAARSLKALSGGLGAARVTTNRRLSTIRNGGCFLLNWPPYGISNVVMRVTGVTTGTLEDGTVEIDAVEDIFAIGDAIYTAPTAIGDSVPVSLDVQAPSDLNVTNITGTTALARWVYATGAEYTEVFLVAGATGSTASGNRVAVLAANAPQFLLRGLANTTEYTVGVRHRDTKGGASPAVFKTFTTTTATASAPRPAAIDIMRVTDAGLGDPTGPFGIVVGLYAADTSLDIVVERAPDSSGSPNLSSITTVATVLGSTETYSDALANDGAVRWYRTRHAIGSTLSDPTIWVSAIPAHLPSAPIRPAAIDAQVDDSSTSETGSAGTLTLGITDPQGRILTCEMATQSGTAAWGGWTSETAATVTLVEKQPSAIKYRVAAYDAANILRTYMFGSLVSFSVGSQPQIQFASITVELSNNVLVQISGDSDTKSVRVLMRTGSAPTAADVIASGITVNGRNAQVFEQFGAGQMVYVGALGYNATGATGLQSDLLSGQEQVGASGPTAAIKSNQADRTVSAVTLSMSGANLPSTYVWGLYKTTPSGNGNFFIDVTGAAADGTLIASGSNSSFPLPETQAVTAPVAGTDTYALVITSAALPGGDWLADSTVGVMPVLAAIDSAGGISPGTNIAGVVAGDIAMLTGTTVLSENWDTFDPTNGPWSINNPSSIVFRTNDTSYAHKGNNTLNFAVYEQVTAKRAIALDPTKLYRIRIGLQAYDNVSREVQYVGVTAYKADMSAANSNNGACYCTLSGDPLDSASGYVVYEGWFKAGAGGYSDTYFAHGSVTAPVLLPIETTCFTPYVLLNYDTGGQNILWDFIDVTEYDEDASARIYTLADPNGRVQKLSLVPMGKMGGLGWSLNDDDWLSPVTWDGTYWHANINAVTATIGAKTISYPGTASIFTSGDNASAYIFNDDPDFSGAWSPQVTVVASDLAAAEGRQYIGQFTTGTHSGGSVTVTPPPPVQGGPNCFPAGTLVTMADGSTLPIERVTNGSLVMAFAPESRRCVRGRVMALLAHELPDDAPGLLQLVTEDGETVDTAGEHRFFTDRGFVRADELQPGDLLYRRAPGFLELRLARLREVRNAERRAVVYNLTVEFWNTYIADGFAVHNLKPM